MFELPKVFLNFWCTAMYGWLAGNRSLKTVLISMRVASTAKNAVINAITTTTATRFAMHQPTKRSTRSDRRAAGRSGPAGGRGVSDRLDIIGTG